METDEEVETEEEAETEEAAEPLAAAIATDAVPYSYSSLSSLVPSAAAAAAAVMAGSSGGSGCDAAALRCLGSMRRSGKDDCTRVATVRAPTNSTSSTFSAVDMAEETAQQDPGDSDLISSIFEEIFLLYYLIIRYTIYVVSFSFFEKLGTMRSSRKPL